MEVEDVLALASIQDVRISPDGRWVAYVMTRRDFDKNINDSDIWVADTDGGAPVRLTYHRGADNEPRWAPDGSWLAFLSDRGEKKQVYGIRPDGGEAWPVTEQKTSVNTFQISPDGQHIAFIATTEKGEEQEEFEKLRGRPIIWDSHYADQWAYLWIAPLQEGRAGEAVRSSSDSLNIFRFVWGPDSKALAFAGSPSPALRTFKKSNVYTIDKAGGEIRQVTSMEGYEWPVEWTETHGLIVSGTGHLLGTYNNQLWTVLPSGDMPLSSSEPVSLTDGLDEHAGFVAITETSLYVESSYRTRRGLYRIPLKNGKASGKPQALTDDQMYYWSFSATDDASAVAFLADTWNTPTNVYVSPTSQINPLKLSDINPQMRRIKLGKQSVVRWKSKADGEEIEGILTLPVDYHDGDRVPLLLVIHGGPSGVSSDRFSPGGWWAYPIQVFAGKGYAVLQPNYRGSTGYGERFRGLNRGDISGRDWIDIDSGVDEMVRQGIADPNRLGIMGWSFGGHQTYWGITQTDRFKAASAGAGPNDLISMYSQTDLPEFYHTFLGPKPWEDFELYEQRSAYRYVENVITPLLIQVGEKDDRVPAEQSIQFYEAVKSIGKAETKLIVYPGQPHGIRDPRLRRDSLIRNVEWFQRWIPTAMVE
jgi:dipeptidyl aminopeptidase/acylaminoacyl peptidase